MQMKSATEDQVTLTAVEDSVSGTLIPLLVRDCIAFLNVFNKATR